MGVTGCTGMPDADNCCDAMECNPAAIWGLWRPSVILVTSAHEGALALKPSKRTSWGPGVCIATGKTPLEYGPWQGISVTLENPGLGLLTFPFAKSPVDPVTPRGGFGSPTPPPGVGSSPTPAIAGGEGKYWPAGDTGCCRYMWFGYW
jgi:hypothetical protein